MVYFMEIPINMDDLEVPLCQETSNYVVSWESFSVADVFHDVAMIGTPSGCKGSTTLFGHPELQRTPHVVQIRSNPQCLLESHS